MTRTLLANALASITVSGALALTACGDGQTGADYRGEPLMSLRGVVTSTEAALSSEQVPALMMSSSYAEDSGRTVYFIGGDVEGMFPTAFTLRVYDAPPAAVLDTLVEGESATMTAQIVAVAPDHPGLLRSEDADEPTDVGSRLRQEICDDTGECLVGYPSECPEGMQEPDAPWPCGGAFPEYLPWQVYGYSAGYSVMYFAEAVPAGGVWSRVLANGEAIAPGYHVIEITDSDDSECLSAAVDRATSEVTSLHDIDASGIFATPDLVREWNQHTLLAYADMECDVGQAIVADTSSQPVELPFTRQPQPFGL